MVVCPECTARAKKKILTKYEEEVAEEDRDRQDLYKLYDEVEIPMEWIKIQRISFVKMWIICIKRTNFRY